MSSAYPWLCSTIKDVEYCSTTSGSNVADSTTDNVDVETSESSDLYGVTMTYYVVTSNLKRDKLFGEDQLQFISRAFYFTGYVAEMPPNVRTYQLQGIYGEDLVQIQISKSFYYYSTYGNSDRNTPKIYESISPRIGDIIYFNANGIFYEIVDVKQWENSFGLKPHYYTATCKVFKDSKYTISNNNTIGSKDPIYSVTTPNITASANFYDYMQNVKQDYSANYLFEDI